MKLISVCLALIILAVTILGTSTPMAFALDGGLGISKTVSLDNNVKMTAAGKMLSSKCRKSGLNQKRGSCQIDLTALPVDNTVSEIRTKASEQARLPGGKSDWPLSALFKPPRLI